MLKLRHLLVTLVVASLVTITIDYRQGSSGPMARLSDAVQSVIIPMQAAVSKVTHPIGAFFSSLIHLPGQASKMAGLQRQVDALRRERIQYQEALAQLNTLQQTLHIRRSYSFHTRAADVIGNGVSNFVWSITIDKGSRAGVRSGVRPQRPRGCGVREQYSCSTLDR